VASERAPRKRTADGRRAELVEAAGRVVARDGVAAATTRRIAEEAGLPHGLVHYWFASKDELLEEVIMTLLRQFEEATAALVGESQADDSPVASSGADGGEAEGGEAAGQEAEGKEAAGTGGAAVGADPATYARDAFCAAFGVVEADDPGNQLSTYELTTWALRAPQGRELARQQYAAYRETAAAICKPWLAAHGADLPEGTADALARFVAVLFDGTVLAWLADPEGTRPQEIFEFSALLLAALVRQHEPPAS
jgi:AcrR family transcriptional regulator